MTVGYELIYGQRWISLNAVAPQQHQVDALYIIRSCGAFKKLCLYTDW